MKYILHVTLLTLLTTTIHAESTPHSHGNRAHNHPLPVQGIAHSHRGVAIGKKVENSTETYQTEKKGALPNNSHAHIKWATLDLYKGGTCKIEFPYAFFNDSRVFNVPIKREDIVKVEFINRSYKSECKNGLLDSNSGQHIRIYLSNQYLKKVITPKLNKPIDVDLFFEGDIFNEGTYKRGRLLGGLSRLYFKVNYSEISKETRKLTQRILKKSYISTHSNSNGYNGSSDHFFAGKNGAKDYYLSTQERAKAELNTSNPIKKHFDLKAKLIVGSTKQDIIGSQLMVISKLESNSKKAYLEYSIKGNPSKLKGKKYKVKVIVDLSFNYVISSNQGGSSSKERFNKELDIILTKENNWRESSKLSLPNITTSTSGKVLGFRIIKKFEGINSKIYIKSIEVL